MLKNMCIEFKGESMIRLKSVKIRKLKVKIKLSSTWQKTFVKFYLVC